MVIGNREGKREGGKEERRKEKRREEKREKKREERREVGIKDNVSIFNKLIRTIIKKKKLV